MTNGEYIKMITDGLKAYHKNGVLDSVKRNEDMNNYYGDCSEQALADAVLVDFVNFLAGQRCMDLAMYTSDLYE